MLEPSWKDKHVGDRVNVLVQPAIFDPAEKRHLMLTSVGRQFICVSGPLADGCAYTLIDAVVADLTKGVRLALDDHAKVLTHKTPLTDIFQNAAETCAGIGVLGTGLTAAGFTVKVSNELRETLVTMQERQGRDKFVVGDINDPQTIVRMHEVCPDSCLLAAGISCQPWSKLGDSLKMADARSSTLEGVLQAGFLLRSWGILIECVTEAGLDHNVQAALDEFCRKTHYRKSTVNLHLEHLMPARRHRWWCLLLSPTVPNVALRPLPKMPVAPTFGDMFPVTPEWPISQVNQLQLDAYETSKFQECGGLAKNILLPDQQVKTALHGWGNQLIPCPCGCRAFPLSDERLRKRGLHGMLIVLEGCVHTCYGDLPATRHMHPYEIAATHGVAPNWNWEPLKLSISGLGQMASPVHSSWIAAQVLQSVSELTGCRTISPEETLHRHLMHVCRVVAHDFPKIGNHARFQAFVARLDQCLGASRFTHMGPQQHVVSLPCPTEEDETPCPDPTWTTHAVSLPRPVIDLPAMSTPFVPEDTAMVTVLADPVDGTFIPGPSHDFPNPVHADPSSPIAGGPSHVSQVAAFTKPDVTVAMTLPSGHTLPEVPLSDASSCAEATLVPAWSWPAGTKVDPETTDAPTPVLAQVFDCADPPNPMVVGDPSTDVHSDVPVASTSISVEVGTFPVMVSADVTELAYAQRNNPEDNAPVFCMPGVSDSCTGSFHDGLQVPALFPPGLGQLHSDVDANPAFTAKGEVGPSHVFDTPFHADPTGAPSTVGPSHVTPAVRADEVANTPMDQEDCLFSQFDVNGGIHAFRSPRHQPPIHEHPATDNPVRFSEAEPDLTQAIADTIDAIESALPPANDGAKCQEVPIPMPLVTHAVRVYMDDDVAPMVIEMPPDATVGSLTVAVSKLGVLKAPVTILNPVGTALPLASLTEPWQRVHLREMQYYGTTDPKDMGMPNGLCQMEPCTRLQLLFKQEGWVALDEMEFYLNMMAQTGHAVSHAPLHIPDVFLDDELFAIMKQWYQECETKCHSHTQVASAFVVRGHWFPVVMRAGVNCIRVFCTEDGQAWIQTGLTDRSVQPQFVTLPIFSHFLNDCGFQCAAWITSAIMHQEFDGSFTPFSEATAVTWRLLFEHHLLTSGKGKATVIPSRMPFGGMTNVDLRGQLQQLLEEHGVPSNISGQRADNVLDKLGRQQISHSLRGPNAWRDIKSMANQVVPKLQLVLASELQTVIQQRLQSNQQFGAQKKKAKQQPRAKVEITPEDISVPSGIFKEGENHPISQLMIADIGPVARGVVVVSSTQAAPYLRIQRPVSSGGLGLLVLDHQAMTLHGIGDVIRFPARSTATGEPILLTAKLIQLGSTLVTRNSASGKPRIDEVSNQVLKAMIYRDEATGDWDKICQRPVKWLVEQHPELNGKAEDKHVILDCWDRQFLSGKLERCRPEHAGVFAVTMRLAHIDVQKLVTRSGHGPTYFEPRSDDGRQHADQYRVIWLNKHDKESAVLALQSTERWCSLVRAGDRYGIRVMKVDAEFVHKQHKPMTPFLDGSSLQLYTAGPFPFGATRQSLAKMFGVWAWPARPLQPRGRTADHSGMIWEVQASAPPEYEIYQMEHGDVLITEVQKKAKNPTGDKVDIQGSAKTIAALTKQKMPSASSEDPWETYKGSDPWSTPTPPTKVARHWEQKPSTESIAAQVENRILRSLEGKLPQFTKAAEQAMTPAEDARIQAMETRMSKLETTVSNNQAQQERQHAEVTASVSGLQQQLSHQGSELQRHFDQRLQEQLNQIEQLLTRKRPE